MERPQEKLLDRINYRGVKLIENIPGDREEVNTREDQNVCYCP